MNLSMSWNNMKKHAGFKTNGLFGECIQSHYITKRPIFRGLTKINPLNNVIIISQEDIKTTKNNKKRLISHIKLK